MNNTIEVIRFLSAIGWLIASIVVIVLVTKRIIVGFRSRRRRRINARFGELERETFYLNELFQALMNKLGIEGEEIDRFIEANRIKRERQMREDSDEEISRDGDS